MSILNRIMPVMDQRIVDLNEALSQLGMNHRAFAESLVRQYKERTTLSEKQWYWVEKLLRDYSGKAIGFDIPNFEQVEQLLRKGLKHTQFPAIRIPCGDTKITLRPKTKAGVNVRVECYDKIGEIHAHTFVKEQALDIPPEKMETWLNTIREFAANPVEQSAFIGKKMNWCCYCGLTLTNPSSIFHGYGPICAENYGLPWGDVPSEFSQEIANIMQNNSVHKEK